MTEARGRKLKGRQLASNQHPIIFQSDGVFEYGLYTFLS